MISLIDKNGKFGYKILVIYKYLLMDYLIIYYGVLLIIY